MLSSFTRLCEIFQDRQVKEGLFQLRCGNHTQFLVSFGFCRQTIAGGGYFMDRYSDWGNFVSL